MMITYWMTVVDLKKRFRELNTTQLSIKIVRGKSNINCSMFQ